MTISRNMVAGGVAVVALTVLATLGVVRLTDDPDREVEAVQLGAVSTSGEDATGTGASPSGTDDGGAPRAVVGLEELSGTGTRSGGDVDDLSVDGIELDFGPDEWVVDAGPIEDFDGDGDTEPLRDEIDGLVDQPVDLLVSYDDDGERDDADVYEISGLTFRDPSGPAPWEPEDSAAVADEAAVTQAAADEIGAGSEVVEVDRDDEDGAVVWEVEVIDADGREHTVLVDAAGEVLGSSQDD